MQTLIRKKVTILLILIFAFFQKAQCQSDIETLQKADSLFQEKRFTQALKHYEALWEDYRWYSPQMLLKMAYIKENAGDIAGALYYINLYHLQNPQKDISYKIKTLAEKNNFTGYEYDDFNFLFTLFKQYNVYAIILLMTAAFIIFMVIIRKRRKRELMLYHPLLFVFFLAISFLLINYGDFYKKGIIGQDMVYLMNAPSAGAELLQVVDRGHMVTIKGKEDVWYQIDWQGEDAFIHQKNLLVVEK